MNPFPLEEVRLILPVIAMFVAATVVLVVDLFLRSWNTPAEADTSNKWLLPAISLLGTITAFVLTVTADGPGTTAFNGALRVDLFSSTIGALILLGTLLTIGATIGYLRRLDLEHGEFYALVLYAAGSMLLLAQANNLIMLFVSLETFSMAVYILSSYTRDAERSVEGALKYFVLGGVSSGFLLFGLAFVYGSSGEIRLDLIGDALTAGSVDSPLLLAGLGLCLVGLGFKVGSVPFHSWIPDAYEGAPSLVTAFMSVTVKSAAFAILVRFALVLSSGGGDSQEYLIEAAWWLAAATMIFGNLVALVQTSVKRMLSYSAISHTGYLLVGVVAALKSTDDGRGAPILFYLLPYTLMTFGSFALLAGLGRESKDGETFDSFRGLSRRSPFLAFATMIFMVSLSGIPPTAGFWGKLYLFRAAVAVGEWPLALIGIAMSIVSVYYYLRLVVVMYMQTEDERQDVEPLFRLTWGAAFAVAIAAAGIVGIGLLPGDFLELSVRSLSGLR